MGIVTKKSGSASKLWCSYKIGLDVLNAQLNRASAEPDAPPGPIDPKIETLLADPDKSPATWERLFEAERRLFPLMSDDMITADALRRFSRARQLGIVEADELAQAFADAPSSGAKRAFHGQMVDSLQYHHFKRDMDRTARRTTASNLNALGILLLAPTVIIIGLLVYLGQIGTLAHYHIILVMWFGLLGAYLSRMIAFQTAIDVIEYDHLLSGFSVWSVIVRLIVGAMGALIVYMMITGRLVGGDLFPNLTGGNFFDQVDVNKKGGVFLPAVSEVTEVVGPRVPSNIPNADLFSAQFAKLLVWATIAGFSERLLPDRLAHIERLATATDPADAGR